MDFSRHSGDPAATSPWSSTRRLLVFAVLLPAAVALTNQVLFESASRSAAARTYLYHWMAASTAVLSWCVGRYLQPTWLRWVVFAWSLVLLDLLTIAACLHGPVPSYFALILVSSQISLLVLWSVLADVGWQWRLPGVAAAAPFVIVFARNWSTRSWDVLWVLSALVVALVCGGLLWSGFALRHAEMWNANAPQRDSLQAHQFGMKHMLIWATVAGPLLLAARGLDYLMFASLDRQSIFPAIVLSFTLATVSLIAIWAVLGAGLWPVRVVTLLLVPLILGFGLERYSDYLRPPVGARWRWAPIRDILWSIEDNWIVWLWLDAMLLAALLLFVRANGYLLVRKERLPDA